MDDKIRTKTMLSIPNPASGPPRIVGPPELVIAERDQLRDALDAARARIAELGLPDDAAPRNPLDLPDRAEVWVRCRLKNRGDSPDVQPIGSEQRAALDWAALDPREPLTVLAAEHPRLIYGHPGGIWHYADEPCVCPGTPHDPTRE